MRNGGAAHQNIEAPQSINNGDARRSADKQVSRLGFPDIDRLTANDKDFSLTLEMTIRESFLVTSHKSPVTPNPCFQTFGNPLSPYRHFERKREIFLAGR